MVETNTQRLRAINSKLMQLYIKLNHNNLDMPQEQVIRSRIVDLETERDTLPSKVRYDDKVQQYVMILKSSASSLQFQRKSLQAFSGKSDEDLSADELRQKNILHNKFRAAEKKLEKYREKLAELGLLPFEIDDVILDGFREQNQRGLQNLLRTLESTITDYLLDYYDQYGEIPQDLSGLIASWDQAEQRLRLRSNELQLVQAKENCLRSGIPVEDVNRLIQNTSSWSPAQKRDHLDVLRQKLTAELSDHNVANVQAQVEGWIQQFDAQSLTLPRRVEIVILIKKLRMYGVAEEKISSILDDLSDKKNDFVSNFIRRFRQS